MTRGLPFLLLLATALPACAPAAPDDGRLDVVATTGILADLARSVGGGDVRVTALMGPGVDPHLYRATEGDAERLAAADLIVANGLHLEGKMGQVLERLGERTVAVAESIPLRERLTPPDFDGAPDPHVWMDPVLWQHAARAAADALIRADPANADAYRSRLAATLDTLAAADADVRRILAVVPPARRVLVTGHDAFAYLGRAYGVRVVGLQGISTAAEAGAADVSALAAFVARERVPALFVETSLSPRAMQAVRAAARSRGHDVALGGDLYADALGPPGSGAETLPAMLRANARTIARALGRPAASGERPAGSPGTARLPPSRSTDDPGS